MKTSAGILLYRRVAGEPGARAAEGEPNLEVLLAHPGGPYFRNKDDGAWTLPKGELADGEEPLSCALREFREETGIEPGDAAFVSLGEIRQKGGKRVLAWAFDGSALQIDCALPPPSNTFELEWPPRSGKRATFPEIDRMQLFDLQTAQRKILPAQSELLTRLCQALDESKRALPRASGVATQAPK